MSSHCAQTVAWLARHWRWVGYIAFVSIRLWGMARDQAFPLFDGVSYFAKAAWMAADPLHRAMSGEAFAHIAYRPPGPMWMLLPFMMWQPSFEVFAGALSLWIVLLIEVGVRSLYHGRWHWARNPAALLLLFGMNVFFVGYELFYVDALLTAQTIAAIGLGVAWLRQRRWPGALGCGMCLAFAIWTKPAGVLITISVGCALLGGWGLTYLRGDGSRILQPLCSAAVQGLCFGSFPLLAIATLLYTPYAMVFHAFQIPMTTLTLARTAIIAPFSLASVVQTCRLLAENLGLPLTLAVGAMGLWALGRAMPGSPRLTPPGLYGAVATGMLWGSNILLPLKVHRYLAPAAAALLCWFGMIRLEGKHYRYRALGMCAAIAVGWRLLCIWDVVPSQAWLRGVEGVSFSYSMVGLRAFLTTFNHLLMTGHTPPLVLSTDVLEEVDALWTAQQMRYYGIAPAIRNLGVQADFTILLPPWPAYDLQPLRRFPYADLLIVGLSPALPFPPGSTSADWQKLNKRLGEGVEAAKAGWQAIARTERWVLYQTAPPGDASTQVPLPALRAQFLAAVSFDSPQGQHIVASLYTIAALRGFTPAHRQLTVSHMPHGVEALLLHAEYPGNAVPHTVRLAYHRGDHLSLYARQEGEGDGTLISILTDAMIARNAVPLDMRLPHRGEVSISLQDVFGEWLQDVGTITLTVLPGPAGDTTNDAVWCEIRPTGLSKS